jgi:biofilm PGA synthesis N-glycosyltransferase PgaC
VIRRRSPAEKGETAVETLFNFIFFYPLLMSFVWVSGALIFHLWRMDRKREPGPLPPGAKVSVLIPCHDEEGSIEETIRSAMEQDLPDLEVIAVDDASTDRTGEVLARLQAIYPRLRVLTLATNQGKAVGLTMAAMASRGDTLVCVDADAVLAPDAVRWLVSHFRAPRVGAVTGNPRVRNRTTVLAKIQVAEYSSIIGMIKRAHRVLGKVFTVSGVVVAFRKAALADVGFWSNNMVTEDMDVSWKLQLDKWDVRYEPRALCWILVPERLRGLWRQRLRWAQGGVEVLMKYAGEMPRWSNRRMWPLFLEYTASVLWCYAFTSTVALWAVGHVVDLPPALVVRSIVPGWTGVIIASACLVQFAVGIALDRRYDRDLGRVLVWLLWYPAIYWLVNCLVTVAAVPKAVLKERTASAVWQSPDRGLGRSAT